MTTYSKKQEIANYLVRLANYDRSSNSLYDLATNHLYEVLLPVKKLGNFASKIVETIDKTACNYQVAKISSKQAWIIACAAVENNIEVEIAL